MSSYNHPGVYIEDFSDSPQHQITGVGGYAGFIGVCTRTPDNAVLITNMADFDTKFTVPERSYLGDAVRAYFDNGGNHCVVCGIIPKEDKLTVDDLKASLVKLEQAHNPINVIALPGISDESIQLAVHDWCENSRICFAIFDTEKEAVTLKDLQELNKNKKWGYAAVYSPWLITASGKIIPPSGAVAGVYARSDHTVGIWKAPTNQSVIGVKNLYHTWSAGEQEILQSAGINLIRAFDGQGIRLLGTRTRNHTDPVWKYINVRRLIMHIEDSIKKSLQWTVFEPNTEDLRSKIKKMITAYLSELFHYGAVVGSNPQEAFFVTIDRTTMTDDDIINGKLICEIGIAPLRPAEFVIFKIELKTAEALY